MPTKSYLICASQRSGTTMLCRALIQIGIAGRPEEYFLAEDPAKLADWHFWEEGPFGLEWGVRDRQHYLETVLEVGTTRERCLRGQAPLEQPAVGDREVP